MELVMGFIKLASDIKLTGIFFLSQETLVQKQHKELWPQNRLD